MVIDQMVDSKSRIVPRRYFSGTFSGVIMLDVKGVGKAALKEIETGEANLTATIGKNNLEVTQAMDRSNANLSLHADFDATAVDIKSSIKKGFDATLTRRYKGAEVSVTCSQSKTGDIEVSVPLEMRLASASILHDVACSMTYNFEKSAASLKLSDSFSVDPMDVQCKFAFEDGEPALQVTGKSKLFDFSLSECAQEAVRACSLKSQYVALGVETTRKSGKVTDCKVGAIVGQNGFRVGVEQDIFKRSWMIRTEFAATLPWLKFSVGGSFARDGGYKSAGGLLLSSRGYDLQVLSSTNEALFARISGPLGNGVDFSMGAGVDRSMKKYFGLSVNLTD